MKTKVFAAALFVMTLCVFAQDKVGYINMSDVFEQYYKTLNANIIFENKKKEYDDKMTMMGSDLEMSLRDVRTAEAEAKNELLAQNVREEAARKFKIKAELFQTKRNEFERSRQQGLGEIRRLREETEEMLVKELRALIDTYATTNGYTHIYDVSGNSLNRMPFILVYPKQQEISATFIASINAGHDAEIKDAKAKLEAMRESAKKNAITPEVKQQ